MVALSGSSPRTRGAPKPSPNSVTCSRIIPAYAGSTVDTNIDRAEAWDHPRVRGEHDVRCVAIDSYRGSSPRTRGARTMKREPGPRHGIIPAYAGSTAAPPCSSTASRDHPRVRGEHVDRHDLISNPAGSSPRTRGAPGAGRQARRAGRDHPRVRGEHRLARPGARRHTGSSPRTRGARTDTLAGAVYAGIIPAYAGSTLLDSRGRERRGDHPRVRGERGLWDIQIVLDTGSSPRTRGAPWSSGWSARLSRDHPRVRGEHLSQKRSRRPRRGSSPRTRGAPPNERRGPRGRGIIPAYAGSTEERNDA